MIPILFQILQSEGVAHLDEILERTTEISEHTSNSFWHSGPWEVVFDSMTFLASFAAIIAIVSVVIEYWKLKRNKDCQSQVLQEIMRYMYGNDVIIEVIRLKMNKRGWKDCYPNEAVLRRFSFIDLDLEIANFAVTAKNYNLLHEFQLFLRNYNIMAETTAEHFRNIKLDKRIKMNDLFDLQHRGDRVFSRIEKLRKELKLNIPSLHDQIIESYRGYFDNKNITFSEEEKTLIKDVKIPARYKDAELSDHYLKAIVDKYNFYYDIEIFPLTDDFKEIDPFQKNMRKRYNRETREFYQDEE